MSRFKVACKAFWCVLRGGTVVVNADCGDSDIVVSQPAMVIASQLRSVGVSGA